MSVNLQKGQKVDLTKDNSSLKTLVVGLGWDEAPRGFSLFQKREDIDCDASAILINANTEKLMGAVDVVYFGNLTHRSGAVRHCGDNLTGAGDGDDEQIIVELRKGAELCKYNLSENYDGKTAMIFGEVYRFKGEWKFGAIGEPTNDNSIGELAQRYQ